MKVMKKALNKTLTLGKKALILTLLLSIFLTIFAGCQKEQDVLLPPADLWIEDGVLKWSSVENVDDYILNINGSDVMIKDTKYSDLTPGTPYSVSVKSSKTLETSKTSEVFSFKILNSPKNLRYKGEEITFDKVDGAVAYSLSVGGKTTFHTENTILSNHVLTEAGRQVIKIKAVGDQEENFDSSYSLPIEVNITPILWEEIESVKPFGNGSGSLPYRIENMENFKWFYSEVKNGKTFAGQNLFQSYDLDFRYVQGYDGIGTKETSFLGTYNGGNCGIYYLFMEEQDGGVFTYLGQGGKISSLNVYGSSIEGRDTAGAIVARNSGIVTSCTNSSEVRGSTVGGIIGVNGNDGLSVLNVNHGSLNGTNTGGIVGWNYEGGISSCRNYGYIYGVNLSGGISSFNGGNIVTSGNYGLISGGQVGGITGENRTKIESSKNDGNIVATVYGGGISGVNNGKIISSIAYCDISITGKTENTFVGGIVGRLNSGEISLSFFEGGMYAQKNKGAFVGYYRSGTIEQNYTLSTTQFVGNTEKFLGISYSVKPGELTKDLLSTLNKNLNSNSNKRVLLEDGKLMFDWE